MKTVIAFLLSLALLSSCAATPQNSELEGLVQLIDGTFETLPENTDNIITDRRIRISSPHLEGIWFYTQLNTGSEQKLYRQRIANLTQTDAGQIVQKTYGLKSPEKFENAWKNLDLLNAISTNDFERYFDNGCGLIWQNNQNTWEGYVDPKTCIVESKRRNMDIHIESEARLSQNQYQTNERGFDADGKQLWGTPTGEFITLIRRKEK